MVDRSVGRFGLLFISFLWLNANTFLYCHLPDINFRFNHSNIDLDQFQFEWNGICRNENSLRVFFSFSFFALRFFFTLNYHDGILSFIGSIVSAFHKTYKCRFSFQYIFHKSCVRTTKLLTRINLIFVKKKKCILNTSNCITMNTFMRIANKNKSMTSTAIYITKKGKNIQNEKSKSQLTHTRIKCKHKYTHLCFVCMLIV